MKKLLALVLLGVSLLAAAADYETLARKASRFFDDSEWASAQALYEMMLLQRPDSCDSYAHAIVASALMPDTVRVTDLLERSASHGVGVYDLFERVRVLSFNCGHPSVYGEFLELSARRMPWLSRPVDAALLNYYLQRDNGPMIVEYAGRMHRGLPGSCEYIEALAKGYMLCGDFDNAVLQWKQMLELDPDNYLALVSLGNFYADNGGEADAVLYLSRAYEVFPTPYVLKRLKGLGLQAGRHAAGF